MKKGLFRVFAFLSFLFFFFPFSSYAGIDSAKLTKDEKKIIRKYFTNKGIKVESVATCQTEVDPKLLMVISYDYSSQSMKERKLKEIIGSYYRESTPQEGFVRLGTFGTVGGPQAIWCEDIDQDGKIEIVMAVPSVGSGASWFNQAWEWNGKKYVLDEKLLKVISDVGNGSYDYEPEQIKQMIRKAALRKFKN